MLGGSELSLLEKMAEINDRMCNSALLEEKGEQSPVKNGNDMKFSFNKNHGSSSLDLSRSLFSLSCLVRPFHLTWVCWQ